MTREHDDLQLDYQTTVALFQTLADIRFRLLAFVPAISGTAVALVRSSDPYTSLSVGLLGLAATLGIVVYELRNSQIYNWTVHRAKFLERRLGLARSAFGAGQGGVFGERPGASYRLAGVLRVKHDVGLALVYGAAVGGWTWLVAHPTVELTTSLSAAATSRIALGVAAGAGALLAGAVVRHDRRQAKPAPSDDPAVVGAALDAAGAALDRLPPGERAAELMRSVELLDRAAALAPAAELTTAVHALREAMWRAVDVPHGTEP